MLLFKNAFIKKITNNNIKYNFYHISKQAACVFVPLPQLSRLLPYPPHPPNPKYHGTKEDITKYLAICTTRLAGAVLSEKLKYFEIKLNIF